MRGRERRKERRGGRGGQEIDEGDRREERKNSSKTTSSSQSFPCTVWQIGAALCLGTKPSVKESSQNRFLI